MGPVTINDDPRAEPAVESTADRNRQVFQDAGVFALALLGGPGCGKSTLIRQTVERMPKGGRVAVVAAGAHDVAGGGRQDPRVTYVSIGTPSGLDAAAVGDTLARLDLASLDVVFIENVGTLTVPPDRHDLGQEATVAVFSVAAGDDKARKYPELVAASDAVVLSKIDLLPAVPFDPGSFRRDVRAANPSSEFFEVSALNGRGLEAWLDWLRTRVHKGCGCPDVSHWFG